MRISHSASRTQLGTFCTKNSCTARRGCAMKLPSNMVAWQSSRPSVSRCLKSSGAGGMRAFSYAGMWLQWSGARLWLKPPNADVSLSESEPRAHVVPGHVECSPCSSCAVGEHWLPRFSEARVLAIYRSVDCLSASVSTLSTPTASMSIRKDSCGVRASFTSVGLLGVTSLRMHDGHRPIPCSYPHRSVSECGCTWQHSFRFEELHPTIFLWSYICLGCFILTPLEGRAQTLFENIKHESYWQTFCLHLLMLMTEMHGVCHREYIAHACPRLTCLQSAERCIAQARLHCVRSLCATTPATAGNESRA